MVSTSNPGSISAALGAAPVVAGPEERSGVEAERELTRAFASGLRPEPRLSLAEWADRYRYLSTKSAATSGRWRTDRAPYLRDPMEALSVGSPTTKVVLQFAAQLGKTELIHNLLGYVADQAPGPVLWVWPTLDLARAASKTRIQPLFDESPRLQGLLQERGQEILEKSFPGGGLSLAGSNAPAGLSGRPIRYLLGDEVDRWSLDAGGEGSPLRLAEARTKGFPNRKILLASTPTDADTSAIEREARLGTMEYFHVPCPHCGTYQRLVLEGVRWTKGDPDSAVYVCQSAPCGLQIEERHKTAMLRGGRWVATGARARRGVRSFLLSSLYSPFGYSWADAAGDWETAQGSQDDLKAFVNTVLGETWKDQSPPPEWEQLRARSESYPRGIVPRGGLILTAGADVQKDRIEVEILALGRGLERWSVDYLVLPGDPTKTEVWDLLRDVLSRQWPLASGGAIPIRMLAVDNSYEPDAVFRWIRKQSPAQVAAVRGRDNQMTIVGQPIEVEVTSGGRRIRRGNKLWFLGSGLLKSRIYGYLRLERPGADGAKLPSGFSHHPDYGEEWFRQITAERLVSRSIGRRRRRAVAWEKIRERNEALDCRVYAEGAAEIAGIGRYQDRHWAALEVALGLATPPPPPQDLARVEDETRREEPPAPPTASPLARRRSPYWERWRPTPR